MKIDDLKMELREESTKVSKYFQSADDLQMQLANEKRKVAQYENELILSKYNMDLNLQAAATSIGVNVQQLSLYMASTFVSSITTLGMYAANTTHALKFFCSTNGLSISTIATQTGQHVSLTASLTTAGSGAISVLSSGISLVPLS